MIREAADGVRAEVLRGTRRAARGGACAILLAGALGASCARRAPGAEAHARAERADIRAPVPEAAPVVVELFTSEGCSSCPPADALLAEIDRGDLVEAGRPVVVLSFHVDYWNDLGWADPFSAEAFTRRQRAYARAFGERGLYTPQMVIGGREGFVGSDRARAEQSLAAAAQIPPRATLSLRPRREEDATAVRVFYALSGQREGASLALALIEAEAEVRVARGENEGRTLRHVGVVRGFRVIPAPRSEGEATLSWRGAPPDDARVVGFLQRDDTLEILGVAEAPL